MVAIMCTFFLVRRKSSGGSVSKGFTVAKDLVP